MFCYQCQETAGNQGCTRRGICGKEDGTAGLQDLLVDVLKGLSVVACAGPEGDKARFLKAGRLIIRGLFATVTNVNFEDRRFVDLIRQALDLRQELSVAGSGPLPECAVWQGRSEEEMRERSARVGVLQTADEDIRSLRELITYGLKGMAAYLHHAEVLGFEDVEIYRFMAEALSAVAGDRSAEELTGLVLRTGETAVQAMELLDRANTSTYGHPELSRVNIGVRGRPGILISGHDLKDLEELLAQTEGSGVDVYTHGEMLPAHYYPAFRRYAHFAGNYGNAWWKQQKEFESFGGPIIMTTNCLTPVRDSYRERIFTTGVVGYPGARHIPDRPEGGAKDFSEVIRLARTCPSPIELERGEIVGGFAHDQVSKLADRVVSAVKQGRIRRFVVMAGCDGRQPGRGYFREVAEKLPMDAVILTAGCAKYRYNKLPLGEIDGIPRVLDAGQCNDSYSLALIALKLKEAFGLSDVNELPLSFDIAWYEQKAVTVLLALLHLGFKGIRLGPTLPAFLSPGVAAVLTKRFGILPIGQPDSDIEAMMAGR